MEKMGHVFYILICGLELIFLILLVILLLLLIVISSCFCSFDTSQLFLVFGNETCLLVFPGIMNE
jgi:hypothetical protein